MEPLTGWFEGLEPYLRINLGRGGVALLLDSGFTGDLWLPGDILDGLGWPQAGSIECRLANDMKVARPIHVGQVAMFGREQAVAAIRGDGATALAGLHLLKETRIEISPSQGRVIVTPLPHMGGEPAGRR